VGFGFFALQGDAKFEVGGDAMGFGDDESGEMGWEDLDGGFFEEVQPSVEVLVFDRQLEVGHHRVAFVTASGEQDGRPEILEECDVGGPVGDCFVEDGADFGIVLDLAVEGFDEACDLVF